ncbi:hypothetical protein L6R52_22680 [Myxococcota bacterium]|nr:hypothetical protein [Myxococcota bacterium]
MDETKRGLARPGTTSGAIEREGTGRVFPCERCGADLVFHIGVQRLRCPRCDHEKVIELEGPPIVEQDLAAKLAELRQQRAPAPQSATAMKEIRCEACGANVRFDGTLTSTECEYCGAPRQLGGVHTAEDRIAVNGIIPFRVEKKEASANLAKWVTSRWFAPNEFLRRGVEGRFSGVYLPYWTFDAATATWYAGLRGDHYTVTVERNGQRTTEIRTRWTPASGSFQRFFDDVLVCASTGLPEGVVTSLEPWPLDQLVPYTQQVLSGYLAQTYDLDLAPGFERAKKRIDQELRADVHRRIGGNVQQVQKIDTRYDALTFKHLLLPVWMLTYRYGDKPYRVIVNATTGEVQGERPYSAVKIFFAALFGLVVAAIVAYLLRER